MARRPAPFRRRRSRRQRRTALGLPVLVLLLLAAAVAGWLAAEPEAGAVPTLGPGAYACAEPYVHDGDNIRCGGVNSRLYGIDAPEMAGACRPGRACTPGDPIAARDNLRGLVAGRAVECRRLDTDRYQRPIVRCLAGGVELSCAQVDGGFAVERYGKLEC